MVAESEKSHARQSLAVKKPQKTRLGNGELEVRLGGESVSSIEARRISLDLVYELKQEAIADLFRPYNIEESPQGLDRERDRHLFKGFYLRRVARDKVGVGPITNTPIGHLLHYGAANKTALETLMAKSERQWPRVNRLDYGHLFPCPPYNAGNCNKQNGRSFEKEGRRIEHSIKVDTLLAHQ